MNCCAWTALQNCVAPSRVWHLPQSSFGFATCMVNWVEYDVVWSPPLVFLVWVHLDGVQVQVDVRFCGYLALGYLSGDTTLFTVAPSTGPLCTRVDFLQLRTGGISVKNRILSEVHLSATPPHPEVAWCFSRAFWIKTVGWPQGSCKWHALHRLWAQ